MAELSQYLDYAPDRPLHKLLHDGTGVLSSGRWSFASRLLSGDRWTFELKWENVDKRVDYATGRIRLFQGQRELWSQRVDGSPFPFAPNGSISSGGVTGLGFETGFLRLVIDVAKGPEDRQEVAAATFAASTETQFHDVVLVFPRCSRQLWTTSALLRRSPYFETLLSSSFAETSISEYEPCATTSADPFFDDSDDEGDARLPAMPLPDKPSPLSPSSLFKVVTIDEAAYTTYLAVLCWLQTGRIVFAPLLSSFKHFSRNRNSLDARWERLTALIAHQPSLLPLPVSSKSVYRLADLLELPDLQQLALLNFRSQLTVENAPLELFTDLASCYEEVRELVLGYVLENKAEVFKSEAMKQMMALGEAAALPQLAMGTWVALLKRMM